MFRVKGHTSNYSGAVFLWHHSWPVAKRHVGSLINEWYRKVSFTCWPAWPGAPIDPVGPRSPYTVKKCINYSYFTYNEKQVTCSAYLWSFRSFLSLLSRLTSSSLKKNVVMFEIAHVISSLKGEPICQQLIHTCSPFTPTGPAIPGLPGAPYFQKENYWKGKRKSKIFLSQMFHALHNERPNIQRIAWKRMNIGRNTFKGISLAGVHLKVILRIFYCCFIGSISYLSKDSSICKVDKKTTRLISYRFLEQVSIYRWTILTRCTRIPLFTLSKKGKELAADKRLANRITQTSCSYKKVIRLPEKNNKLIPFPPLWSLWYHVQ